MHSYAVLSNLAFSVDSYIVLLPSTAYHLYWLLGPRAMAKDGRHEGRDHVEGLESVSLSAHHRHNVRAKISMVGGLKEGVAVAIGVWCRR